MRRVASGADGGAPHGRTTTGSRPGARPGTTAGGCCRARPPTCATRPRRSGCASASRPGRASARAPSAPCGGTSRSARTRGWRSICTCARRCAAEGSAARCSRSYWRRARELGAEVVRGYAPLGDAAWDALAARHHLQEVECDRFLLLELDRATISSDPGPAVRPLAGEPAESEREAWRLEAELHAALGTSAAYVPETFAEWRARVLEAPGSERPNVLVTRAPGGELAGICALRVCVGAARDGLPRVHGRGRLGARPGPRSRAQARGDPARARARGAAAGRRHEPRQRRDARAQRAASATSPVLDVRNLEGTP